jgi:hypothetical protein
MKPYLIAEICYDATNPDRPWYTVRNGTIAGQGGSVLGTERSSFSTIEESCDHLALLIYNDLEVIKEQVAKREQNG